MRAIEHQVEVIAIGASAGGLEALGVLLQALPHAFPAAILVVQHLSPDGDSLLRPLLARRCALPVKDAEDKEIIAPGTVYLAVPDYHLLVEPNRSLALSREEPVHFSRPSVDLLFESAAEVYGTGLLAIVLTGANHDGAEGLRRVREAGGAGWVQDPDEAVAPAMPAAALAHAGADAVLPLAAMAARLGAASNPVQGGLHK